jgi:hypothetical protein
MLLTAFLKHGTAKGPVPPANVIDACLGRERTRRAREVGRQRGRCRKQGPCQSWWRVSRDPAQLLPDKQLIGRLWDLEMRAKIWLDKLERLRMPQPVTVK